MLNQFDVAMKPPLPVFDSLEFINETDFSTCVFVNDNKDDYEKALEFLKSYKGNQGTFNAYRREIERLLHWCTLVAKSH